VCFDGVRLNGPLALVVETEMVMSQQSRQLATVTTPSSLLAYSCHLLSRTGAGMYLGTYWLRSGNVRYMPSDKHVMLLYPHVHCYVRYTPSDKHVMLLYPHVHCHFLMSRSGALTGILYILYNILVWHHLQAVSAAIGSITTHAPTGEFYPSRINLQKISQQQMVIQRKAAAHSLYTNLPYRCNKQLLFL
jgi:hypothetical protein